MREIAWTVDAINEFGVVGPYAYTGASLAVAEAGLYSRIGD